jgi:hypothetical protein
VNRSLAVTVGIGVLGMATLLGAARSGAEEPKKSVPAIEPAAAAAVDRMGDYVKTLPMFSVRAETTTDEVLLAGPKVQYGGAVEATYRAPDGLWMRVTRDETNEQQFFYDGKSLSLWIEGKQSWASVAAPGTVAETITLVESKYDLTFPLGDLLAGAVLKTLLKDVQAGIVIGTGRVAGVECDHLGFHQAGADWQLWIEKGDRPLPRKIVITTLGEPSQPQHSEVLTWDLSPKIDAATFTFTPPVGAQRIVIAERPAAKAAAVTKKAVAKKEVK